MAELQVQAHKHYKYQLLFNEVQKKEEVVTNCDLKQQRNMMRGQLKEEYWKNNIDVYIAYCGKTHCTSIKTTKDTQQASKAPSTFDFDLIPPLHMTNWV